MSNLHRRAAALAPQDDKAWGFGGSSLARSNVWSKSINLGDGDLQTTGNIRALLQVLTPGPVIITKTAFAPAREGKDHGHHGTSTLSVLSSEYGRSD